MISSYLKNILPIRNLTNLIKLRDTKIDKILNLIQCISYSNSFHFQEIIVSDLYNIL